MTAVQLWIPGCAPPARPTHRSDHLRTPAVVIERVAALGPIGLDPCAAVGNVVGAHLEWHGPPHEAEDGLDRAWTGHGLVYCFPPPRAAADWAAKIACEAAAGAEILALLPARVGAPWLHDYIFPAAALCYWRGGLRCLGDQRGPRPARLIAYFGSRVAAFRDAFAPVGAVHADAARPTAWRLTVPLRSPTGTWIGQQGAASRVVRAGLARFAAALTRAVAASDCPPATGPRRAEITRYGAAATTPESLESGGAYVVAMLVEARLLSERHGYRVRWRQRIDRHRPRTEIALADASGREFGDDGADESSGELGVVDPAGAFADPGAAGSTSASRGGVAAPRR
jgi:hypothetical protein